MIKRPEVLVFVMRDCPACSDLEPIAHRMKFHYGTCIDTRFVDVDDEDEFADAMGVEETPTVIGVNSHRQPMIRMVGHDGGSTRLARIYDTLMENVVACRVDPFRDV